MFPCTRAGRLHNFWSSGPDLRQMERIWNAFDTIQNWFCGFAIVTIRKSGQPWYKQPRNYIAPRAARNKGSDVTRCSEANFRAILHQADRNTHRQTSTGVASIRTRRIRRTTNNHETSRSHSTSQLAPGHWPHTPSRNQLLRSKGTITDFKMETTRRTKFIKQRAVAKASLTRMQTFIEQVIVNYTRSKSGLMNCQIYLINLKVHRVT